MIGPKDRVKDIISATLAQVQAWEECMYIDRQMLQNAY